MAGLLSKQPKQSPDGEDDGATTPPKGRAQAGDGKAPPKGEPTHAAGAPDEDGESGNVSPEEQAQYDTWVQNGMNVMYDEKAMPQLLETIRGDGSPVEGLATALSTLVMRLEDSAEKSGQQISGDVKLHGAQELLEQMVELAEEAGIHEFTPEEMESAFYLALDTYRSTRQEQGKLPVEELSQDMNELAAAEQQGTLGQMLPGIEEYAQKAPQPGQQGGNAAPAGPPPRRGLMG